MKRLVKREWILENVGYKATAFVVALILWMTLLGRRDFVVEDFVNLQLLVPQQYVVKNKVTKKILLKVSGPRLALQEFAKDPPIISIDLAKEGEGIHWVEVPTRNLNLPLGVRVLSLDPEQVRVHLVQAERGD